MISILRFCFFAAGLLTASLAISSSATAIAYLNAADWLAALPGQPIQIIPFPSYTAVSTDAFGTPGATGSHSSAGGAFSGSFECRSFINPCSGAYQITYSLPFEIIGFEGQLSYNNGWYPFSPVFPVPLSTLNHYDGFYGELFAPTDTITLVWQPGVISTDSFATFRFVDARIVRAISEPGALLLLASGLLGLGLARAASGGRSRA